MEAQVRSNIERLQLMYRAAPALARATDKTDCFRNNTYSD